MAAVTSLAAWCIVVAFVARACVPRSLDLRVYRDASSLVLHGGAPYAVTFTSQHFAFTYPPFALFLFAPLTALNLHTAIWTLDALGAACLVVTLALCARRETQRSWTTCWVIASLLGGVSCLALEPLRSTLLNGQVNLVLLACVVVDLLAVPPRFRGILVGLAAAVKLTPLVFVLYLLVTGERRAAIRACATFTAATALLWLALPTDSATFWLHQAFSPSRRGASRSAANQSWWGLVGRLPAGDGGLRTACWLALCAATVVVGCVVARRCVRAGRRLDALLAIAVTGLLVSPVSWTHHWCWIALVAVALLAGKTRPAAVTAAFALLVLVAVLAPYGWHVRGAGSAVPGFSLLGAGAVLLATMFLAERRDLHAPPGATVAALAARRTP
jgi:alpha-1,2-mannosyltransferase